MEEENCEVDGEVGGAAGEHDHGLPNRLLLTAAGHQPVHGAVRRDATQQRSPPHGG